MSGNNELKYALCVEWTVNGRAYSDTSSYFCFLDSECYLFTLKTADDYILRLGSKSNEILKRPIEVTTSIRIPSNSREPIQSNFTTLCKSHTTLWRKSVKVLKDELGKSFDCTYVDFICVFHSIETTNVSKNCVLSSVISPQVLKGFESLSMDLSSLLKDKSYSDVQLKCRDRTFAAHKSVLTARSKVFAAMFRNKMAEEQTGVVGIQDMDPNVLEVLLKYMYSGKEPDVRQMTVRSLYVAADKYAVQSLKETCCDWMASSITENNYLEWLVLADMHSDENLKKQAVHFISKRPHLLGRESWSSFKREHPHLAITVLEEILRHAHWVQSS